jgi:hypothetical protein
MGTLDGAVYRRFEEIVPTDEFPLETPATSQLTALLVVPETVAVNCCDTPTCTLALPGQIVTETVAGAGVATEKVLRTVTDKYNGAVYKLVDEIVSLGEFPPAAPATYPTVVRSGHCGRELLR